MRERAFPHVRACAPRHLDEFATVESLAPAAARAWAQDATACAVLVGAELRAAQVGPPSPTPVGPADPRRTVDNDRVRHEAMRHSSWVVARAALGPL